MYSSGDPHRVQITSGQNPINAAYTQSPDNSQVSVTSTPDGNYIFLMQLPNCPPLHNIASASNSTTEFGNSRVGQTDSGHHRAIADASNSSVSGVLGNPFPVGSFALVKPLQGPPQPTFFNPGNSFTSQNSFLTSLLSQPNSPQLPTQGQMMPQHFVVQQQQPQQQHQPQQQQQSSSQSYAPQGSGAVPAATQTFMFLTADHSTTSSGSFYALQPASPQMAAAAMQSGTAQIISPLQLSSPRPQVGGLPGQVAYVVNSAAPQTVVSYPAYAEHLVTFQGPGAWQRPANVAFSQGPPPQPQQQRCPQQQYPLVPQQPLQQRQQPQYIHFASQSGAVPMSGIVPSFSSPTPSTPPTAASAILHAPTTSTGNVGNTLGTPAAGGSPGGAQPAALGVRSFMAPKPVGNCMVRDAPLIPNIPPLALPCPAWGKIPAGPARSHASNTSVALPP